MGFDGDGGVGIVVAWAVGDEWNGGKQREEEVYAFQGKKMRVAWL